MARYERGQVVLVRFTYQEDETKFKIRPAIVIREDTQGEYLICQITTNNRSDTHRGYWVEKDSSEGVQMKLKASSFINADRTAILNADLYFIKPWGWCPFIDELEELIDE